VLRWKLLLLLLLLTLLLLLLLLLLLQTFRPDGSARWQAVSAVHELPDDSLLLAKIVRAKGERPTRKQTHAQEGSAEMHSLEDSNRPSVHAQLHVSNLLHSVHTLKWSLAATHKETFPAPHTAQPACFSGNTSLKYTCCRACSILLLYSHCVCSPHSCSAAVLPHFMFYTAAARPAAAARPQQQQHRPAAAAAAGPAMQPGGRSHGLSHAIGGLFKKLVVGGSSAGGAAGGRVGGGGFGGGGGMGRMGRCECCADDVTDLQGDTLLYSCTWGGARLG
jgi:hypothetical protein